MEALKETPVLKFNPNTLQEVRSLYDLEKPGRIEEAIRLLEEWIQKQEHFMNKNFEKDYLERHIVMNKGLLERSKSKLEKLCTFRTLLPEFFQQHDIREIKKAIPHFDEVMTDALMPRLTVDNYRVYLLRYENIDKLHPGMAVAYIKIIFWFCEYIYKHDYAAGVIFIIDIRNMSIMEYISSINVSEMRKMTTVIQEGYGMRIKGVHYVTNSKLVEGLLGLTKSFLTAKLAQRIHFHTNLDTVHEMVPKEVLSSDYGGNEKPLSELRDLWVDVLGSQENIDYMKNVYEHRTDESKRVGEKISDQYLPGSFRTLSVD